MGQDDSPTAQQVFDRCVEHLFTQRRPSFELASQGARHCLYRCDDGRRCAVGLFIPDVDYDPMMDEGNTDVSALLDNFPSQVPGWFHDHQSLLDQLQTVHDRCQLTPSGTFSIGALYHRFKSVAKTDNLSINVLESAYDAAEQQQENDHASA